MHMQYHTELYFTNFFISILCAWIYRAKSAILARTTYSIDKASRQ